MGEEVHALQGVSIIRNKRLITHNNDGTIIMHVANTPLEKEPNTIELIRKLPGVSGLDDNIVSLWGGEIVFLVDGRKLRHLNELSYIEPNNIKSIELDRSPGAEFSSSVGLVVKITTQKHRSGWYSSINSFHRMNHFYSHDNSVIVGFQKKRLNINGITGYSDYRRKNRQDMILELSNPNEKWSYRGSMKSLKNSTKELFTSLSLEYAMTPSYMLGIKYDGTFDRTMDNQSSPILMYNNDILNKKLESYSEEKSDDGRHYLNVYYDWKPSKRFKNAVYIDYLTTYSNGSQSVEEDKTGRDVSVKKGNDNRLFAILAKGIYKPDSSTTIEGGIDYSRIDVNTLLTYMPSVLQNTDSRRKENKVAGFLQITYDKNNIFGGHAGLRYEHAVSRYHDRLNQGNSISGEKNGVLLPFFGLFFNTDRVHQTLNYDLSIVRPSFAFLNGSSVYLNQFLYQESNPKLKSQLNHRFQYGLQFNDFTLRAQYQYIRNAIQMVLSGAGAESRSIKSTFANTPESSDIRVMTYYSRTFGKYYLMATLGYLQSFAEFPIKGELVTVTRPQAYFSCNNTYSFTDQFGANLFFEYSGYSSGGFMKIAPMSLLNLRIYYTFLDNQLQVTLQMNDVFNANKSLYYGHINNVYMENHNFSDYRSITLRLKWKLNQRKKDFGGQSASEDDIYRL